MNSISSTLLGMTARPHTGVGPFSTTYLADGTYIQFPRETEGASRILLSHFSADGTLLRPSSNLKEPGTGRYTSLDLEPLSSGGFVVGWTVPDSNGRLGSVGTPQFRIYDSNVDPVTAAITLDAPEDTFLYDITPSANDTFLAVWGARKSDLVRWQVFGSDGQPVGTAQTNTSDIYSNSTQEHEGVVAAALPDGGFLIAGTNNRVSDLILLRLDANGAQVGTQQIVNTEPVDGVNGRSGSEAGEVEIAVLEDGGFVVAWVRSQNTAGDYLSSGAEGPIAARVFNADGSPRTDEFQVSVFNVADFGNRFQNALNVDALPDGGFLITYNAAGIGFTGRVYSANGTPQSSELPIMAGPSRTALVETVLTEDLLIIEVGGADGRVTPFEMALPHAPTGTLGFTGSAVLGGRLTADLSGFQDRNGIDMDSVRYQWLAEGQAIKGATGTQLDLTQDLAGREITLQITYADDNGALTRAVGIPGPAGSRVNVAVEGTQNNDTLDGGVVGEAFDGMGGTDIASYAGSAAHVNVSLATGYTGGGEGNSATGDRFVSIEGLIGSAHDDRLIGGLSATELRGGEGNDILRSSAAGSMLDGGADTDTADFETSDAGVTVNLGTGANSGGTADGVTLTDIENLTGSRFDDMLTGDGSDNMLQGRLGADVLSGGGGQDTADYTASSGFVNVSFETGYAGGGRGSHAIGDSWIDMERFVGSRFDDRLNGNDQANAIFGAAGDDILRGRGAADVLDGGAGSDTADYEDSDVGVNVNLGTGVTSGGDAEGDSFVSIENLTGSRFDDTLTGDSGDNVLRGRLGADVLSGGAGQDTADYTGSFAFVNVSLATGYAGGGSRSHAIGDTFHDIENLGGSMYDDLLNGDGGSNRLTGAEGNDTLRGGGGADVFAFADGFDADTVTDFEDGIDRLDFSEHSGVSRFGNLTIGQNNGNATVTDGQGNSIEIIGAAGLIDANDFDF